MVTYDLLADELVIRHADGREERLTPAQVRQRALWRDGRFRVEDVLGVCEVPLQNGETNDAQKQRVRMARFKAKIKAEREIIAGRPQPSICEICHSGEFRIVWDHCHTHGHFRGWICDRCNKVLGMVKDNHITLDSLSYYLMRQRAAVKRKYPGIK